MQMNEAKTFPKKLRFTRFIFWLGLVLGIFILALGILCLVTGSAISILGGNSEGADIWLKLAGYGVLEIVVFVRLVSLLPKQASDVPTKIVKWLYCYTVLQLLFSAVRFFVLENQFDFIFSFLEEWTLLVFFYLYIATVFRFQDGVAEYYGTPGSPSKYDRLNKYGRKFVGYIGRA